MVIRDFNRRYVAIPNNNKIMRMDVYLENRNRTGNLFGNTKG